MKTSLVSKMLLGLIMCLVSVNLSFAQRKHTPSSYIEKYKNVAQQLMKESGVPASVILAVAIHESAHGNSRVATNLNNHFGIKGKNSSKKIKSAYKGYPSVSASYKDFIAFLKRRKSTQNLFEKYSSKDYTHWVKGIAKSGYSATGTWSSLIIGTIERYNLHEYDAN